MQPQDPTALKPPSSALISRERLPTGSTHPTTAMSQKSRGITPLKMPPLVQQTPRGPVFSSEQSLLGGNPQDSNPCFISFRKSITETRSLATELGRFTDSGWSLSTATGHRQEVTPQDEPNHRQSMAVVIQDTPSIRDSGILPEIQEFRSFSPEDLPAPSIQNFPKSFTYGRAGLNTPLRDLHYSMPPAGPSTFLTDTMSVTRRSDLMSRETSAFGDEKKEKPRLPVIKERSVRHSLPQYNRSATAKRQVRNFEDTMWNGQKTVRLGIVNQRRLIRHGVHHLTHKLGMECNFQLMHFGRQIGDLMSDLKREIKIQEDTNQMMDYQLWQLNEMKEQIQKDTREATYDVTHIELTAHARNKKQNTDSLLF